MYFLHIGFARSRAVEARDQNGRETVFPQSCPEATGRKRDRDEEETGMALELDVYTCCDRCARCFCFLVTIWPVVVSASPDVFRTGRSSRCDARELDSSGCHFY